MNNNQDPNLVQQPSDNQSPNQYPSGNQYPSQYPNQYPNYGQQMVPVKQPSHGLAVASLVLGIVSLVLMFFSGIGFIPSVVGIALAAVAKKNGNEEGINKAGLVMSIITAAISAVIFLSCVGCAGCAACGAGLDSLNY